MFNYGVFRKTVLDTALSVVVATIGLVAFVVLFVWAMLNMGTELLAFVSKFPFLQKIFEMSLGIQVSGEVSINILFAVCFTHLVVMSLVWFVVIATTTRVTTGEIERGTADLLLTMPVRRREVFASTSLVWVLAAVFLSFVPIAGIWIGVQVFETEEAVTLNRYLAPAVNFACLNLAIGGIATLAGCLFSRRGLAIGFIVAVVFVSALLNFLEPFIGPAEGGISSDGISSDGISSDGGSVGWGLSKIRFLGLLSYYRPVDIVRTGDWPVSAMVSLLAIGTVCWVIGLLVYCRKDIPTA